MKIGKFLPFHILQQKEWNKKKESFYRLNLKACELVELEIL